MDFSKNTYSPENPEWMITFVLDLLKTNLRYLTNYESEAFAGEYLEWVLVANVNKRMEMDQKYILDNPISLVNILKTIEVSVI